MNIFLNCDAKQDAQVLWGMFFLVFIPADWNLDIKNIQFISSKLGMCMMYSRASNDDLNIHLLSLELITTLY